MEVIEMLSLTKIYEVFKNLDTSIDDIPSNDPNIGFNYYYNDISQSLT